MSAKRQALIVWIAETYPNGMTEPQFNRWRGELGLSLSSFLPLLDPKDESGGAQLSALGWQVYEALIAQGVADQARALAQDVVKPKLQAWLTRLDPTLFKESVAR